MFLVQNDKLEDLKENVRHRKEEAVGVALQLGDEQSDVLFGAKVSHDRSVVGVLIRFALLNQDLLEYPGHVHVGFWVLVLL